LKWWDLNGDGDKTGEPILSGWTIDLLDASNNLLATTTTDAQGMYAFDGLTPGVTYKICEKISEAGWFQTWPINSICPAGYAEGGYQIPVVPGLVSSGNDFGNNNQPGCTLTQGYWKTHGDPTNLKKYDDTWDKIGPLGSASPFFDAVFDTGMTWMEILEEPPAGGNAYLILAHQYIAAYLNSIKDVDPADTTALGTALIDAAELLKNYSSDLEIPKDDPNRAVAIMLAETLDDFNNGIIGPGHCEY
jgi:hypothetical protein